MNHLLQNYTQVIEDMNTFYEHGESFLFILDYKKTKGICVKAKDINSEHIRFSFDKNLSETPHKGPIINLEHHSISFDQYENKFNQVKDHILKGNSYLCNLTQATKIKINLSLEEIYRFSLASNKLYLKDLFVVFSPETFVDIKGDTILTYPMKGTISADEERNREILLNDLKEDAEHNTIVDLLRNDLSIVANNVRVNNFKILQKINTNKGPIWQMSSEISGKIKSHFKNKPGNLFDKILPAGSVTGAPKEKTVEIIDGVENYDRGFYTGIFGYCNGEDIHSAVMIRFIEQTNDGLVYKSGGGITCLSVAAQEYQELIQKIYVPVF